MAYKCRLLSDVPSEKDAFGSHERVANALTEIIMNEESGKAIALIGGWGTGKSTVVNLLSKNLKNVGQSASDLKLFVFDAWAHEGDPLRRSFLERLILSLKDWLPNFQYWEKDALEEIKRRKKSQIVSTTPVLTKWGARVVFAVFGVPVGLTLFKAGIDHSVTWMVIVGLALTLAPIVVSLLALRSVKKEKSEQGTSREPQETINYLAGLLINKSVESVRTTTTETPEPTSVEFEKYYSMLLRDALEKNRKRRLCIVIDNLDRMGNEDAVKLIATLKPFLQPGTGGDHWQSQVFYLIPFDESSLEKLWKKNDSENFARSFLDKIFQMRLYVPQLLISDWQSYFDNQLKLAFGGIEEDRTYSIRRIYDSMVTPAAGNPTPRQIISFINHLVGVYQQWKDEIPLAHQALFVVLRVHRQCDNQPDLQKNLNELGGIKDYCQSERVEDDMAALFYNVEPSKARELWMEPTVEEALKNANQEYFLKNENKKVLDKLVDNVIEKRLADWKGKDPRLLVNAAAALANTSYRRTHGRLRSHAIENQAWPFLDRTIAARLSEIIGSDRESFVKVLRSVRKIQRPKETEVPTAFVEGMLHLVGEFSRRFGQPSKDEFFVEAEPSVYIEVLSAACSQTEFKAVTKYLRPKGGIENQALELFKGFVEQQKLTLSQAQAFKVFLSTVGTEINLVQFIDSLFSRINSAAQLPMDEMRALGIILLSLRKYFQNEDGKFRHAMKESVETGWLYHHLYFATSGNGQGLKARSILLLVLSLEPVESWRRQAPNGQHGYNYYTNSLPQVLKDDGQLRTAAAEDAIEFECVDDMLAVMKKPDTVFAKNLLPIIGEIIRRDDAYEILGDERLIENFQLLMSSSGDEVMRKLLSKAVNGTLVQAIQSKTFRLEHVSLLTALYESEDSERVQTLTSWVVDGLKSVSSDVWHKALQEKDSTIIGLLKQVDKKAHGTLGVPLYIGMKEIIEGVANRTLGEEDIDPEQMTFAFQFLDKSHSVTLKSNCRNILIRDVSDDKLDSFVEIFSGFLSDNEIMAERSDDLVELLVPKALDGHVSLANVDSLIKKCPDIWRKAKPDSRVVYLGQIVKAIENEKDPDRKESLTKLKEFLEQLSSVDHHDKKS